MSLFTDHSSVEFDYAFIKKALAPIPARAVREDMVSRGVLDHREPGDIYSLVEDDDW